MEANDASAVRTLDEILKKLRMLAHDSGLSHAVKRLLVTITDQFSHTLAHFKRSQEQAGEEQRE